MPGWGVLDGSDDCHAGWYEGIRGTCDGSYVLGYLAGVSARQRVQVYKHDWGEGWEDAMEYRDKRDERRTRAYCDGYGVGETTCELMRGVCGPGGCVR